MGRSELDDVPHRTSQKFNHVNIHQHRLPGARLPRSLVMSKESYYSDEHDTGERTGSYPRPHRGSREQDSTAAVGVATWTSKYCNSKYSLPAAVAAAADNCAVYFRCGLEINGLSVHRVVKDTPRTSVAVVYGVRGIASLYLRGNTTSHSGNRASPLRSW